MKAADSDTLDPPRLTRRRYVDDVLTAYGRTPGATGFVRASDRRLAALLYDQGVPVEVVHAALALAAVRRLTRPADAPPLEPVRSLHYFRPVVDEILRRPLDPVYLSYLQLKLADLTRRPADSPR